MKFIEWKREYSVNIREIDDQHKKLIDMLNELFEAMHKGDSKILVRPVLEQMVDYAKSHFATEEKYFEQYDYPEVLAHVSEHKDFIAHVNKFIRDYKADKVGLSLDVMTFLKQWLASHILGSDKRYSSFLNYKGLY